MWISVVNVWCSCGNGRVCRCSVLVLIMVGMEWMLRLCVWVWLDCMCLWVMGLCMYLVKWLCVWFSVLVMFSSILILLMLWCWCRCVYWMVLNIVLCVVLLFSSVVVW